MVDDDDAGVDSVRDNSWDAYASTAAGICNDYYLNVTLLHTWFLFMVNTYHMPNLVHCVARQKCDDSWQRCSHLAESMKLCTKEYFGVLNPIRFGAIAKNQSFLLKNDIFQNGRHLLDTYHNLLKEQTCSQIWGLNIHFS